jgi:DNA-directed RNA polymerase sigma subunit (sigma70/sigma32)
MLRGEDEGWTLQAVGDELGVTRERVRQIQNNIEPKLKRFCLRNGISL